MNSDTHFTAAGNLQDGMSLSGTNSIPLATGGTASVPSAANTFPQHTASYFHANLTLTAPGTHLQAAYPHISPHGSASSTQPAIPLPSHSQGPTPASTPPTVPNDTKGPGQYQQNYPMNQHNPYRGIPTQGSVVIANSATRPHTSRMQHMTRHNLVTVSNPVYMFPHNANLVQPPNFQPGAVEQFYMQNSYNSFLRTPAWPSVTRSTAQNVVSVPGNPTMQNSVPYFNMSQVQSMPQQQTQQTATPLGKSKKRSHAVPIVDPVTQKEIVVEDNVDKEELSSTTNNGIVESDKKDLSVDIKRGSESSSSSYSSSTFSGKEQSQSVLNGTAASNAPYIAPSEWKPTPHSGNASGFSQVDDNVVDSLGNSVKSASVSTPIQPPKMDFKKPTREDTANIAADLQSNDAKLRDKPSTGTSAWPGAAPVVPPSNVVSTQTSSQRGVPVGTKKVSKEAESSLPSTGFGSCTSPPTTLASVMAGDGVNKATPVTISPVVLDDTEMVPKKATKQGILPKDGIPSAKPVTGKPVATATSSQSLPETTQPTISAGGPLSAQNNVTKLDSKSQSSVPQNVVAQVSSALVTSGAKPPATALSTSGPVSEKTSFLSASTTSPSESFPSKAASTSVTQSSVTEKEAPVKEDTNKSSPSTKTKNRGKDQPVVDNSSEHSSSNVKGKSAQSLPKHLNVDVAKPTSTSAASMAVKQTNGEAVEQSVATEGKSKKKKGSKKELNKKGLEKEGSDMDMFTNIEKAPTLSEKNTRAEKVPQPNSQPVAVNTNTISRSKTNSSQKSENSVISVDVKEKVIISPNIPVASTVPAQFSDTSKTEDEKPLDKCTLERKKYPVEFMLKLRHQPECNLSVELMYTPVLQYSSGSRSMSQNGFSGAGNFLPDYIHQTSMTLPSRKSQQGSMRRDKPNQIHVSLSLREEVPLRRSKDAWKPTIFNNDGKNANDETEALYKAARGILNKLTPEKFPVLKEKFKALKMDTSEKLSGVIDLTFEKAVDEPGFCKWYAEMCNVVQDHKAEGGSEKETFRYVLLNKCQYHFESAKAQELDADIKRAEINASNESAEKKKEMLLAFEEKERKTRRKSVGNCRFIGELYKLKMLTPKIMVSCIRILIGQLEEESLECLCKLLTTIGKELDEKLPKDLDQYFKRLQEIADARKTPKISSRIRFMIQDVIDLRKKKWVPRRETDNPKTIEQINMEIEKKEYDQKLASMTTRKSYDDYSRGRDSRKNRNDNQSVDASWKTVTTKNSMSKPNYKYDAAKLANITAGTDQDENNSFGRPSVFNLWKNGSGAGAKAQTDKNTTIQSQVGGRMDPSRSLSVTSFRNSSSGKLTPSSSMERAKHNPPLRDNDTNKMSRSGSTQNVQPASRESSMQRSVPSRNASQTAPTATPTPCPLTSTPSEAAPLDSNTFEKYHKTILEEFIINRSVKDTAQDFVDRFKVTEDKKKAIEKLIGGVLEKPFLASDCAKIFGLLLKDNVISVPMLVEVFSKFVKLSEDFRVDYPQFWQYMVNIFCELPIVEDCILYNELKTVLKQISKEEYRNFVLTHLETKMNKCILNTLLYKIDEKFDDVTTWIDENVEKAHCNADLVIALTEAVCEKVLNETEKSMLPVSNYSKYFKKYVDNEEKLELTCLQTILDFNRRKENPKGFLLMMFEGLYDKHAISIESFLQFEKIDQPGIGVALMSLKGFYDFLKQTESNNKSSTE